MERIRVAQVVTRFVAGAGGVAMRGAEALDPDRFDVAIVAAPGGDLLGQAERDGFEVIQVPDLVPDLEPVADARALRELCTIMTERRFDVVHTHSAKAGALGRVVARLVGVPAVVHTFHGFPFHEFQSRGPVAARTSRSSAGSRGSPIASSPWVPRSRPRRCAGTSHRSTGYV